MKSFLPVLIAATALGTAGLATAQPAVHAATTTKTVTSHAVVRPGTPVATRTVATTRTTRTASAGRRVTTRTATGKTVTYDCAKAGNASKKACRG